MLLNFQSRRCHLANTGVTLFPHQQAMLAKVADLERAASKRKAVGVMKDPPGTGKSYVVLAMILAEKRALGRTQNLFVLPENLCKQWMTYITQYSRELTYKTFTQYGDITALYFKQDILHEFDILITTSGYYMTIAQTMQHMNLTLNRVVLDEIDSISFFTQTHIPTRFTWLISASADLTKQGIYQSAVGNSSYVQCDSAFIDASIKLPAPIYTTYQCHNKQLDLLNDISVDRSAINALDFSRIRFNYLANAVVTSAKTLVSAIVKDELLHIESLDQQVDKQELKVPALVTLEGRILHLQKTGALPDADKHDPVLTEKEVQIAVDQANLQMTALIKANYEHADAWETRNDLVTLRKTLQEKVNMIIERVEETTCPVCLEDFTDEGDVKKVVVRCCNNVFCLDCLKEHLRRSNKCAKCRQKISTQMLIVSEETGVPKLCEAVGKPKLFTPSSGLKDKLDYVLDIVKQETATPGRKLLIFSDYAGTFRTVRALLETLNVSFAEIEGTSKTMEATVDQYQRGNTRVLLIDSMHYGAGLNLEMTSAVILIHRTDRMKQIVGRAQRIGRTTPLVVYQLLYGDE